MIVDIIFVLLLAYGFYLGFSQKIIRVITLSLTVIFALLLSLNLVPFTTELFGSFIKTDSSLLFFIALLASFIVAVFLIRIVVSWLENIFKKENVGIATRLSSGLIMGAILLVIYGLGLNFFDSAKAIAPDTKRESVTYKFTRDFPNRAKAGMTSVQPVIERFWDYVSGSVEKNYKASERRSRRRH
ncbi:MAG TPA: CvpA family protein [Bacteroidetes bacterium]|nr:CvpA family protein [Bacteroidota bacterium]